MSRVTRFEDSLSIIEVEVGRILAGVEPDLAVSIATIRQAADELYRVAGSDTACPAVTHTNGQLAPKYRANRKALTQMRGER